jgi:PAS domain S-box-containing protein
MRLLLLVLAADTLIAVVEGVRGLRGLAAGDHGWHNWLGALGTAWLAVILAALWRTWGRVTRAEVGDDRLAAVAATSHEWLWQTTPEFVSTYCSPASAEIIGRTPGQIVGRSLFDFMHGDDVAGARAVLEAARRDGTGWTDVETRWLHTDGRLVTLQGSAVPMLDSTGRVVGFRGTRRLAPPEAVAARRRAELTERIRRLLEHQGLKIALQPIVDLTTGRWTGVEALSRFPDRRAPDVWFAEACEAGLTVELEQLAIRQALSTLGHLPDDIRLSVNASPEVILDAGFADALSAPGVALDRITVEITEHAPVTRYDDIHAVLAPLRERGLQLAVDDTGAGYASFHHVLRLRPDVIKLDRSLLMSINTDPARRAFVTAIVLLALELHASVTAEGVENLDELVTLATLGVDHAQGYLLARPETDRAVWQSWAHRDWPTGRLSVAAQAPAPLG